MIFLGAGASVPFRIPTAPKLTDDMRNIVNEEHSDLLHSIDDFNKKNHLSESNYEDILTYLNALSSSAQTRGNDAYQIFANTHPEYRKDYSQIIDNTYNLVCDYCTAPFNPSTPQYLKPDELEKIFQDTYDPLIGLLLKYNKPELVFSTNYDPSLEIWCQKRNLFCLDGSISTDNPEVKKQVRNEEYSQYRINAARAPSLVLVRLHGSIWTRKIDNKLVKFNRPKELLSFSDLYRGVIDKNPYLVFPGQEDNLSRGEWDPLYKYFKENLKENCLFIGYSFRHRVIDNPILDCLHSGKIKKLGVLGPNPDNVLSNLFEDETEKQKYEKEGVIVKLLTNFGSENALKHLAQDWMGLWPSRFNDSEGMKHEVGNWRKACEGYIS